MKFSLKSYPVIVHEDKPGLYWVECPSIEGCYSQGKTIDQALQNIREAINLCLEDMPKQTKQALPTNVSLHFVTA